ncbi:glycerol-3-phosphate 1-O-acyltransferase PlsY [candidate division WOR-3 bacterium]|nr:glycerol-3-phosphate 1-O-acyltransferase PlsY [candidate division WOR-3 bacterium]
MIYTAVFLFSVCSFLLGGIPTGLIISRRYGKDPRKEGSRNIGATNVIRTVGLKPGLTTFLLDILKGVLPVLAAKIIAGKYFPDSSFAAEFLPSICAICAVAGHVFSPYLGFRGGKGVATGLGTVIVLTPVLSLVVFCVFLLLMALFRIVSLGSIFSALSYAALLSAVRFFNLPVSLTHGEFYYGLAMAFFVVFTHRKNIGRLLRGEEKKLNWKKHG